MAEPDVMRCWLYRDGTRGLRHHYGQACRREGMTTQSLTVGLEKLDRLPD
jgi:hypothetical protein